MATTLSLTAWGPALPSLGRRHPLGPPPPPHPPQTHTPPCRPPPLPPPPSAGLHQRPAHGGGQVCAAPRPGLVPGAAGGSAHHALWCGRAQVRQHTGAWHVPRRRLCGYPLVPACRPKDGLKAASSDAAPAGTRGPAPASSSATATTRPASTCTPLAATAWTSTPSCDGRCAPAAHARQPDARARRWCPPATRRASAGLLFRLAVPCLLSSAPAFPRPTPAYPATPPPPATTPR